MQKQISANPVVRDVRILMNVFNGVYFMGTFVKIEEGNIYLKEATTLAFTQNPNGGMVFNFIPICHPAGRLCEMKMKYDDAIVELTTDKIPQGILNEYLKMVSGIFVPTGSVGGNPLKMN